MPGMRPAPARFPASRFRAAVQAWRTDHRDNVAPDQRRSLELTGRVSGNRRNRPAIDSMQPKPTLPTAEATVLPLRTHAPGRGAASQPKALPGPPTAPAPQETELNQADRAFHAMLARLTGGISPVALLLAYTDWLSHLAASPQRQIEMSRQAAADAKQLVDAALHSFSPQQVPWTLIEPKPQDRRFARPDGRSRRSTCSAQAFLLSEQWWHDATTGVRGVAQQNEAIVEFSVRQMLDMLAPSNFAATNPEVLQKTLAERRREFRVRLAELAQRLDAAAVAAGKPVDGKRFRRRRDRRGVARQGRVPQRADRADPVCAGYRQGPSGTDADRAGLDHEILHSRPVAARTRWSNT